MVLRFQGSTAAPFGIGVNSLKPRGPGHLQDVSVVFLGKVWKQIDGVRTCTRGDLLACDLVAIPSNANARVLSARSYNLNARAADAIWVAASRKATADALVVLAKAEIADCKKLGIGFGKAGPARRRSTGCSEPRWPSTRNRAPPSDAP
jgi:hypothetical protein